MTYISDLQLPKVEGADPSFRKTEGEHGRGGGEGTQVKNPVQMQTFFPLFMTFGGPRKGGPHPGVGVVPIAV